MMNGMEKIKNKMEGMGKMSNVKVQSSNKKNNDQSQKSNSLAAQAPKTVNLGFEIKGIDLTFKL